MSTSSSAVSKFTSPAVPTVGVVAANPAAVGRAAAAVPDMPRMLGDVAMGVMTFAGSLLLTAMFDDARITQDFANAMHETHKPVSLAAACMGVMSRRDEDQLATSLAPTKELEQDLVRVA